MQRLPGIYAAALALSAFLVRSSFVLVDSIGTAAFYFFRARLKFGFEIEFCSEKALFW